MVFKLYISAVDVQTSEMICVGGIAECDCQFSAGVWSPCHRSQSPSLLSSDSDSGLIFPVARAPPGGHWVSQPNSLRSDETLM